MIRLYHVYKRYGDISALTDVSTTVAKGEFVYVGGPSGAGKSTFLKLIYGAEQPSEGKMIIGGADAERLRGARLALLRRNIGVVFQDFKLIPRRTLSENVGLSLEVLGHPRDEIKRRVNAVLSLVGLRGRGDERPPMLSGGEQQRVAVARALAREPRVINLRGTTVVVATHDSALMSRFPYRQLRFEGGRLVRG